MHFFFYDKCVKLKKHQIRLELELSKTIVAIQKIEHL